MKRKHTLFSVIAFLLCNTIPLVHALDIDCTDSNTNYIFNFISNGFPPDEAIVFVGECRIDTPITITSSGFSQLVGKGRDISKIIVVKEKTAAIKVLGATGVTLNNFSIHNAYPGVLVQKTDTFGAQVNILDVGFENNTGAGLCVLEDASTINPNDLVAGGLRQLALCSINLNSQSAFNASTHLETSISTISQTATTQDLSQICPKPEDLPPCQINKFGILECNNNVVNVCDSDFITNEAGLLSIGSVILSCHADKDTKCSTDISNNNQFGLAIDLSSNVQLNNSSINIIGNGGTGLSVNKSTANLQYHTVISSNNPQNSDVFIDKSSVLCDETSQIISETPAQDATASNCVTTQSEPTSETIPIPLFALFMLIASIVAVNIKKN